jgi:hypothetical protein
MTRNEIVGAYRVNDQGIITSPGKFEGEMLYVPYLWDMAMEGFTDHVNGVDYIVFEDGDFAAFPELVGNYGAAIEESEQGFVCCHIFGTKQEYDHDKLNQSRFGV